MKNMINSTGTILWFTLAAEILCISQLSSLNVKARITAA